MIDIGLAQEAKTSPQIALITLIYTDQKSSVFIRVEICFLSKAIDIFHVYNLQPCVR